MCDLKKIHLIPYLAVFLSFFIVSLMAASSKHGDPSPARPYGLETSKKPSVEARQKAPMAISERPGPPAVGRVTGNNKTPTTSMKKVGEKSSK